METFKVEVSTSRNRKSSYNAKHTIEGNETQARLLYAGINIGNGYRKRLRVIDAAGKARVLDKQTSN